MSHDKAEPGQTTLERIPPGQMLAIAPRQGLLLGIITIISLCIHVACLIAGKSAYADWRCPHHPVHAAVEMSGGLIALWVAWMLMSLERRGAGTSFNVWIAGALIGMGLLDGMHAMIHAGQQFVWLHSLATFIGGLLFATVWLPGAWQSRVAHWWPWTVAGAVLAIGVGSLSLPESTPTMLIENGAGEKVFSSWAVRLNVGGGLLMLVTTLRLVSTYKQHGNPDDLLFCLHCTLFGAAAVMFEHSRLWDLPWWGWHLLRLMAYGVALRFVVLTEAHEQQALIRLAADLRQLSGSLELRVHQMTAELEKKNENLAQSNVELQQFAYIASHDLQAPLRGISGFAQFLQQDYRGKLDPDADEYIGEIVAGTQRMQQLINDLLAYSRVESRAQAFAPTGLAAAFDDAVLLLRAEIEDCGGEVTHGELPTVVGDPAQMTQLFQNLIGNAIKYHGADPPSVHVSAERIGSGWKVGVRDNGIGIDSKHFEKIFEIFRRLHTQEEYPGTGIGLAVCRRIVSRHGGRLWVESEVGRGSTFFFTLSDRNTSQP